MTSTLQGPVIVIIINIRFGHELELPLLVNTGYVDPTSVNANPNAVSVDTNASGLESPSLVGHGIANSKEKAYEVREKNKGEKRGEWDARAAVSSSKRRRQHFEPTCPFGHGISNPTPYQARRPPL